MTRGWLTLVALFASLCPLVASIDCMEGQGILRTLPTEINQLLHFDACGPSLAHANETVYWWHFGDDLPPVKTEDPWVEHNYSKAGIYPVALNTTYNETTSNYTSRALIYDCTDNATRAGQYVIIIQGNLTVGSTLLVWACVEERTDPNVTISYSWDFGDGSVSVPEARRNQILSHVFNSSGLHNVTVKVGIASDLGTVRRFFNSSVQISAASPAPKKGDDGLSSGDIAGLVTGIIIGAVVVVVLTGMVLNYVQHRIKRSRAQIGNVNNAPGTNYELLVEDDL
jgi:hypothetical protein